MQTPGLDFADLFYVQRRLMGIVDRGVRHPTFEWDSFCRDPVFWMAESARSTVADRICDPDRR